MSENQKKYTHAAIKLSGMNSTTHTFTDSGITHLVEFHHAPLEGMEGGYCRAEVYWMNAESIPNECIVDSHYSDSDHSEPPDIGTITLPNSRECPDFVIKQIAEKFGLETSQLKDGEQFRRILKE